MVEILVAETPASNVLAENFPTKEEKILLGSVLKNFRALACEFVSPEDQFSRYGSGGLDTVEGIAETTPDQRGVVDSAGKVLT